MRVGNLSDGSWVKTGERRVPRPTDLWIGSTGTIYNGHSSISREIVVSGVSPEATPFRDDPSIDLGMAPGIFNGYGYYEP